jgi:hypothetical protein
MAITRTPPTELSVSTHPIAQAYLLSNYAPRIDENVRLYLSQIATLSQAPLSEANQSLFLQLNDPKMLILITHTNAKTFLSVMEALANLRNLVRDQPDLEETFAAAVQLTSDMSLDLIGHPSELNARYISMQMTGLTINLMSLTRLAELPNEVNFKEFILTTSEMINRFDPNYYIHANNTLSQYISIIAITLVCAAFLIGSLIPNPALALAGLIGFPLVVIPALVVLWITNTESTVQKSASAFYKTSSQYMYRLFRTVDEAEAEAAVRQDDENHHDAVYHHQLGLL